MNSRKARHSRSNPVARNWTNTLLGTRIFAVGLLLSATLTWGQLVDQTLAPNTAKAGINKSLLDEIGAGRGDVGLAFYERNYDGSMQTQFVTRPLWGIGTTAPYGHDGRSSTLDDAILRHGGEALASRNAYAALAPFQKRSIDAFLNSLVLFPPDDTASNLDPANPYVPGFPQFGHGSIKLGVLFNNPTDPE